MKKTSVCFAGALAVLLCGWMPAAEAKPKISIKTKHYNISGDNGYKLLVAMNRYGPKHGWWSRSIAQTQYTTSWGASWKWSKGYCRAFEAPVELKITYVYPKLNSKAGNSLRSRWRTFMSGVTVHEKTHGKLAIQMAHDVEKKVLSSRLKTNDKECSGMKGHLSKEVGKVFDLYEKRQIAFDKKEHRDGGNVDRMVTRLVGKKTQSASVKKKSRDKKAASRKVVQAPVVLTDELR